MGITDGHNRVINYLRLSVTDRCNLRCQYCTPAKKLLKYAKIPILSYDELCRVAEQSAQLGIRKIRVTGGEPLVRPGIVQFLERINAIPGVGEVVLTTNGVMLDTLAVSLREAGVKRLNISLDSLKPEVFTRLTGGGDLHDVLTGIEAARKAGFPAPQINVVALRGSNDQEFQDFAQMAIDSGLTIRFIEYMPVKAEENWKDQFIGSDDILRIIGERHTLAPMERVEGAGPARYYSLDGGKGTIGVISPVSKHFCASCNRIRVTSDGFARGCLFGKDSVDLKPYLAQGDDAVREILTRIIKEKPMRHHISEDETPHFFVPMSSIGG
jgi:cyclic pyranopterin phosphate synthase